MKTVYLLVRSPHRSRAALALALMCALTLGEGAGLLLLVPLLESLRLSAEGDGLGWAARLAREGLALLGLPPGLPAVLLAYAAVASAAALLQRAQALTVFSLQHDLVAGLRQRLHGAITRASWRSIAMARASDLTELLTTEVERAGAAVYHFLQVAAAALLVALQLAIAILVSPAVTALVLGSGGALVLLVRARVKAARAAGEQLSECMRGLHAAAAEHLGGVKTVKAHGAEERHAALFAGLSERARGIYLSFVRGQAGLKCWFDVGSVLALAAAVYAAVELLSLPSAAVVFLIYLFARILPRLSGLVQGLQSLAHLQPSLAAVEEMLDRLRAAEETRAAGAEPELREEIRLEAVSFGYGDLPVVSRLDLAVRAGEATALVGPSGAGKTTVLDLIAGLLAPEAGRVLVDGAPLTPERARALRARIGYVGQDPFLLHDTVRENLRWAAPEAGEDELLQALRQAEALEFVARLPRGLDTVLGDRGSWLSAGERQRLALARALLRRPALLILDEPTSHLDAECEERILRALEELRGSTTIVLATHRPAAAAWADAVYTLPGAGGMDELPRQTFDLVRREEAQASPSGRPVIVREVPPRDGGDP